MTAADIRFFSDALGKWTRYNAILPDGETSGYLNWKASGRLNKERYEDLLIRDIPHHVRHHFHAADGPWAIGGLSMGGYGAISLGMKYPERFASIYAHSSAFHIDEMLDPALVEDVEDANVYRHADALAKRKDCPVIAFDCGVDDQLIGHKRRLHEHLDKLNIEHHYAEFDGGHKWEYWPQTLPIVSWTASEIAAMTA